jgi:hypothetical protein
MNAAKLESIYSRTILTEAENSGDLIQRRVIHESVGVVKPSGRGLDTLEEANLTTRSNYVKHSEFLLCLSMRADEYHG